jgi:trans-aconitate methyltransferase
LIVWTQRNESLAEYAQRLRGAYPRLADGTTLFPFRRLFLVVQKP